MPDWGLYIDIEKALQKASGKISRAEAKAKHKDLPPGGVWRTINGHHIYIVNGKVVAGSLPGVRGAKKATKAQLKEYQEHIDSEAGKTSEEKPKKTAKKKETASKKTASKTKKTTTKKAATKTAAKKTTKVVAKTAATKESATAKRLREVVKTRPLTVDEEQGLHDREKNEKVKKEILAESKKRRKEQLAAVKQERAARKATVKKQKEAKEAQEKASLAKRKEQEKEMKIKKVTPKGGKKVKAPDMKRVEVAPNDSKEHKQYQERENTPFKEGKEPPEGKYAELLEQLNQEWRSKAAKILSKPANKRSAKAIAQVAKELTEKYEPVAIEEAMRAAKRRGIKLLPAKLYEGMKQGKAISRETASGKKITEGTDLYGDLQQSARSTLYETIHRILSGAQKPNTGDIAPLLLIRMRTQMHRDMYSLMNHLPAPHEIRPAIADLRQAENTLKHQLGREPSAEELAAHLAKNSKHFNEAPIAPAPRWDEKEKRWVESKGRIKDPVERLRMLKQYADQQKATTLDRAVNDENQNTLADNIRAEGKSPEEIVEQKQRQEELKGAIPQALKEIGLNDVERTVWTLMHSAPSERQNRYYRTAQEVADEVNQNYKHLLPGGKPISESWVKKYVKSARDKLADAKEKNHEALKKLEALKSLFYYDMMKTLFLYDLMKSLTEWGVGTDVLEERYVRNAVADNIIDLKKSLAPYESIGTLVYTDDGKVHARVTEVRLPETNMLYKSFNAYMDDLVKKSMFPHKGASNAAVNKKASEYVRSHSSKYHALANAQLSRIRNKSGKLTWSEQLQLEKGGVWITWGGKKILINAKNGDILYDSKNEAHREEHNEGAPEDKIEFHHEKEALAEHEEAREKSVRDEWESVKKSKNYKKDPEKEKERFAKKHRGVSFDEEGNLHFTPDTEVNEDNAHAIDHGIHAFREQMEEMKRAWAHKEGGKLTLTSIKGHMKHTIGHRVLDAYAQMSEEERKKVDNMLREERAIYFGKRFLDNEKTREVLQKYHDGKISYEEAFNYFKGIGSHAGRNKKLMPRFMANVKKYNPAEHMDKLIEDFGNKELSRAGEEANKGLLPEGKFMVGNPITGKTMVVHIKGGFEGGRGGRGGKYAPVVAEAFDPEGGTHEEINSWGQLGKALGYKGDDAAKLKEILVQHANTDPDKPFMKKISDEEYNKYRAKTKLGLQESMLHKNFKVVSQSKNKTVYAQDMPDGTQNIISVDKNGYIEDPIMARLIKQKKPIRSVDDLHEVLKNAVGNRAWVTAHAGSDIHIGDALGHHIQLEYDGMGAPRVVGGKYDGYRFIDKKDLSKNAVDPFTGEPVKALFNNGKLVDRRFTTMNEVPMEVGNSVMYKDGNRWRKGRIHSEVPGGFKITDGKGNVIGTFSKTELKPAKEEGRTLSESGQAVVRLAKDGTHRITTSQVFSEDRKSQKAKALFEQALKKAKINTHAFDRDGNLKENIELSDSAMNRLKKVLGRSKAGREMLKQFNSTYKNELEIHVPEHLRKDVEAEGVRVLKNGTARISVGKFEQLRNSLGGLSLDHKARDFLADHFRRKDRKARTPESLAELKTTYQPSMVSDKTDFGKHYKSLFKHDSFLMDKDKGLYGTQLEGVSHMIERGRALVGHGMGVGKTITGVVAHAHYKAQKLANGETPKKTLVVAPAGIQSEWGKEIANHTNMKALYIGGNNMRKKDANGKYLKSENGRYMFGQDGTEQEMVNTKHFLKNMDKIGSEDHDYHIISYDQFMRNRHALANSGLYDNIIIDEVHAFKNQQGKRGQSLAETTDKFKNVWGLSGTPMENDAREMWSLIDTITGGRHELGSRKEFMEKYMVKDRNGKITGIKPDMAEKLGDIVANVIQFRNAGDVTYNDGSKIKFPALIGQTTKDNPNPQHDFLADMVDDSRDHQTTDYYGTKHSVTDFDQVAHTVTNDKNGESYEVQAFKPKNLSPELQKMYSRYNELQQKYLPESKLKELATAAATGYDTNRSVKGGNYLTAMQKLQKYLNAPLSEKMYVPGGNAIESDATDAQQASPSGSSAGLQKYNPETGEGHYIIDENGHKRYFESDGKGGFLRNEDGSPKLLPPLHHNNPKAQYLKQRISKYLDSLARENEQRRKAGKPELMPKVVVKSSYTTFGTDVVDGVLRDLQREHPELLRWADKLRKQGQELGTGRFTGDAEDREGTKTGFRGNKNDYANNQGNLWATTVSPAGKEGVDFGNAHMLIHYDQDWNPQKMAQFTARGRRSDSAKAHAAVDRDNSIRVESLHMPGTIEDFLFNAEDAKMRDIQQVVNRTREAEQAPRYGDSASGIGASYRGFTRKKKAPKPPKRVGGSMVKVPSIAASAEKALKLVIIV